MPGFDLLIAFAVATLLFAYMPGPALLYTAAQTMARGRSAGLRAVIGIHAGCYVHVLAAVLGLSAVFRYVPEAFLAVKIAGALYLVWLGIAMIRGGRAPMESADIKIKSKRRAFWESFLVELLNPKVALFFIAFLPQFVDPAASLPIWLQSLILGVIVNLTFSSADLVTVFLTSTIVRRLKRSSRALVVARWCGGSILIGLGAKLALDRN
ncbi:MAG: LysE family translocator [Rhodospirillales bacterium]